MERNLESYLSCVRLVKGQMLMREGDPGDCAYIVVNGRLRVFSRLESDQEHHLADIGRGETVGEMGPLTGDARNATVYAARDSVLLKLPRTSLEAMAHKYPELGLSLARLMARRLLVTRNQRKGKHITTIALIALSPTVPVSALPSDLVVALSHYGATLHLTSASLTARLGRSETSVIPDKGEVVSWLNDEEARHHFVLYEAEPEVTPRTRRCLKQADRILLVASGSGFNECHNVLRDLMLSEHLVEREVSACTSRKE